MLTFQLCDIFSANSEFKFLQCTFMSLFVHMKYVRISFCISTLLFFPFCSFYVTILQWSYTSDQKKKSRFAYVLMVVCNSMHIRSFCSFDIIVDLLTCFLRIFFRLDRHMICPLCILFFVANVVIQL